MKEKRYKFDCIFDESSNQINIFANVGQPLINGFLKGFNATAFAYGQTGSGKTFTIFGPDTIEWGQLPTISDTKEMINNNDEKDTTEEEIVASSVDIEIQNDENIENADKNQKSIKNTQATNESFSSILGIVPRCFNEIYDRLDESTDVTN